MRATLSLQYLAHSDVCEYLPEDSKVFDFDCIKVLKVGKQGLYRSVMGLFFPVIIWENLIMTKLTVNNRFIVLFLSLQILFSLGCTTPQKYEGSREQFDDIVITTKVHEAIIDEPSLRPVDINVRTIKGIVELSGLVNSRNDMDKAIAIARKMEGIKLIKNDIRTYETGDY